MKYILLIFILITLSCKKEDQTCKWCFIVSQKNQSFSCGGAYNSKNGGWDEVNRAKIGTTKLCEDEWRSIDNKVISTTSIPCDFNNPKGANYSIRSITLCDR